MSITSDNNKSIRKAYHSPQLLVYGNINTLTQNLGSRGALDGGGGAAAGPKTGR
jgi:hypothetical protein